MWTARSSDRLHGSKQHNFTYCSWHHLTICRPLTWNSPAWCCATDSIESFKWPICESHHSWQYRYQLMQDNITDRNHRAKGGGLTAIINSKFPTDDTLFTDNVSNVAKHSMCTHCASASNRNVCTYSSNSTTVKRPETKHLHSYCSHHVARCLNFI